MNDPDVRYRATSDGVDIAYWVVGEGPPLIHLPGIPYTHIGHEWRIPEFRRWFELLADRRAMVRYDSRGLGLSQREVSTCSLEAFVLDLDAVIGAVSAAKVALYARVHATPIALAYAARHPERVSHVVLMRGYARGRDHVRSEAASQVRE